jgi:hypothetical protein
MDAGEVSPAIDPDEPFDAIRWVARSLAWERRLRELETNELSGVVDVEQEVADQCVDGVRALDVHGVVGA